jgi:hypothetical protein
MLLAVRFHSLRNIFYTLQETSFLMGSFHESTSLPKRKKWKPWHLLFFILPPPLLPCHDQRRLLRSSTPPHALPLHILSHELNLAVSPLALARSLPSFLNPLDLLCYGATHDPSSPCTPVTPRPCPGQRHRAKLSPSWQPPRHLLLFLESSPTSATSPSPSQPHCPSIHLIFNLLNIQTCSYLTQCHRFRSRTWNHGSSLIHQNISQLSIARSTFQTFDLSENALSNRLMLS